MTPRVGRLAPGHRVWLQLDFAPPLNVHTQTQTADEQSSSSAACWHGRWLLSCHFKPDDAVLHTEDSQEKSSIMIISHSPAIECMQGNNQHGGEGSHLGKASAASVLQLSVEACAVPSQLVLVAPAHPTKVDGSIGTCLDFGGLAVGQRSSKSVEIANHGAILCMQHTHQVVCW